MMLSKSRFATRIAASSVVLMFALVLANGGLSQAQSGTNEALPGARNFTRVTDLVACGGATAFEAFPELKRRGFKTVINLRLPTERGADVEGEGNAVRAAGLTYIHLPFYATLTDAPDPADRSAGEMVEAFLKAVVNPSNLPVYIHSAAAHRASGFWLIKRLRIDGWSVDRAVAEAETIGITDAMRSFALNYAKFQAGK